MLPGPAGRPGPAVLHRVRVLRPRRPRHRRSLARLGPQGARAGARGLPSTLDGSGRVTRSAALALRRRRGDDAARDAIRTRARRDAVRRGGRGTGKTTALVDRIVALGAIDGRSPMRRDRGDHVHREGGGRAARPGAAGARAARRRRPDGPCTRALDELDAAAICTLHAFAQRILTEFPIEAGLPPRIEVLDEIVVAASRSTRAGAGSSTSCSTTPSSSRPSLARRSRPACASSTCARSPRRSTTTGTCSTASPAPPELPALDGRRLARRARRGLRDARDHCVDADDKLLDAPRRVRGVRRPRCATRVDDADRIELLRRREAVVQGRQRRPQGLAGAATSTDAARAHRRSSAEQRARRLLGSVERGDPPLRRVALAEFTRDDVAARRAAGRAGVPRPARARALAAARPRARPGRAARLRERYQRLLIDEFQDTDPIQIELAALLGVRRIPTRRDASVGRRRRRPGSPVLRRRPEAVDLPVPARRHRARSSRPATRFADRARCCSRATSAPSAPCSAWVNHVFGELIQPDPGSQPEYHALEAHARRRPRRARRDAARCRAARRRARRRSRCASARPPTSSRDDPRCDRRALVTSRDGDDVAAGAARRHLHPAPGAHVARLPRDARSTPRASRTAPRRARSSTAAARSATCSCVLRASTTRATSSRWSTRAALAAVRLRRRRPLHVPRRARRPVGPHPSAARDAPGRTIRSPRRCAYLAALHARALVAGAERAARAHRARTGTCSRSARPPGRFRDIARRIRFVVDQARAFGDATRRHAARLPGVGDAAKAPKARGSSRRCCPRPTTTRCGS